MASDPPTPGRDDAQESYDAMLEQLDDVIDEVVRKIEDGRVRDVEKEKVRIKRCRALAYLIRTKRKVLEDRTLEELAEEIEALREEQGGDPVLGGSR